MTNNFAIHHIHIKCADPAAMADWYCNVFGFKVVLNDLRPTGDRLIRCALGENQAPFLIISDPVSGQDLPAGRAGLALGLEHFALSTDNLQNAINRAVAHGGKLLDGPVTLADGMIIAFIEAPGDVRIELLQLPS